jgi:hypothetical protein
VLASVAVAGSAGSRTPSRDAAIDPTAFSQVGLDSLVRTAWTTTLTPDPAYDSSAGLQPGGELVEPGFGPPAGPTPPSTGLPTARAIVVNPWHRNPDESWYGPGFYGQHTACGQVLSDTLLGVANRTLPCGTLVSFRNPYNGQVVTVPVVDRGPYVDGRQWDLTKAACAAIHHCWTGPLDWRFP